MEYDSIISNITTDDLDILIESRKFVEERLSLEQHRGDRAENRSTTMLGVIGLLSGFVIHFGSVINSLKDFNKITTYSIFILIIILFVKSGYYAILAIRVSQANRIIPTFIFDIQNLSRAEAMRQEIGWKVWEYYQLLNPNNARLFWLDRCQRNTFASVIVFLGLGAFLFLQKTILFRLI